MNQETRRIPVALAHNPYEVVIGGYGLKGIGNELSKVGFKKGTKILVVTNPDVANPYADLFLESLLDSGFNPTLLILEAGEEKKNQENIGKIHDEAFRSKIERGSLIIALGGGVIGDMAGFAAATWLRGVSIVQVPTTLLAMVDASIGGKTGINHSGGKNLIGAFHQPSLVLIDQSTLKTLPIREFRAGMAEIIKYGVITDPSLFEILESIENISSPDGISDQLLDEILERSALSKSKIVALDEHEGGVRAILNYGHTFGHVIENLSGYGNWLHGEAVSMGMVAAGMLALIKGTWSKEDFNRQKSLLSKAGLPIIWPKLNPEEVYETLLVDKKVKDGLLRFVMPNKIGGVEIYDGITKEEIFKCLGLLNDQSGISKNLV